MSRFYICVHELCKFSWVNVVTIMRLSCRKYGIFRLSDPGGVQVLQNCTRRGFHQHERPLEGGPIYEDSSHVYWVNNVKYDVIDLR